jgi:prepilin-type N-terminal cleavage/methylation domain-containing protein
MVDVQKGYTLPEILISVVVVSVMAMAIIPDMRHLMDRQGLKVKVARLQTYVDQARHLAATTECPISLNLTPSGDSIDLRLIVQLDPFMRGCSDWHRQASNPQALEWSGRLEGVTLQSVADLRFNAISGVLDATRQTSLSLNHKSQQARVSYLGIGHGIVEYAE